MTDRCFVLKLFSGPQVGGEVTLSTGRYLLGRDEECDLIIDDALVAPKHLALEVGDEAISVELLEGQATVDGLPFAGGPLIPYQYLTIGGTHLATGRRGEPWPPRPLPELRLFTVVEPETILPPARLNGTAEVNPNWLSQISVAAGLIVLSACLVWFLQSGPSKVEASRPSIPLEEQLWTIVRAAEAESEVRVEQSPRGWLVRGYLVRRDDRKQLHEELRSLLPSASILLWDSESLAAAVGDVLSAMKMPLDAQPGTAGEVIVSGSTDDMNAWHKVRSRIRRDVPDIRLLTDEVTKRATTAPRLVSTAQPAEAIRSVPQEDSVPSKAALESLVVANASRLRPKIEIRSVSVGRHRVLVLADGTRVGVGGRVDGWMVMEIEVERIALKQADNLYWIDLATP